MVSWSSKRQIVISRSSAEAEYRGVANAAAECCLLNVKLDKATMVYCDNISTVYLSENLVHHGRTKHMGLDVHFVREKVAVGDIRITHVPTRQQLADIMTKGSHDLCLRTSEKHIDAHELLPSYPSRYEAASLCQTNDVCTWMHMDSCLHTQQGMKLHRCAQ